MATRRNILSGTIARLLGMDLSQGKDIGNGYYDFGDVDYDENAFASQAERGQVPYQAPGPNPILNPDGPGVPAPPASPVPPAVAPPPPGGGVFGPIDPWSSVNPLGRGRGYRPTVGTPENPIGRPVGNMNIPDPGTTNPLGRPSEIGNGSGMETDNYLYNQSRRPRYNFKSTTDMSTNGLNGLSRSMGNTSGRRSPFNMFKGRQPGGYQGY